MANGATEKIPADEIPLREWLDSLGTPDVKVVIERKEPMTYMGVRCGGVVGQHSEPVDEEEIGAIYGGGKYLVRLMGAKGYIKARTVNIAGEPKLDPMKYPSLQRHVDAQVAARNAAAFEPPTLSEKAMEMAEKNLEAERRRAAEAEERARESNRLDTDVIDRITKPFEMQIAMQTEQMTRMQQQIAEMLRQPRESSVDVLGRVVENNDSRLLAIKEQHASELRTVRERHDAEITRMRDNAEQDRRRLEDRFNADLAARDRAHESEIRRMEKAFESEKAMINHSLGSKDEVLRGRIADLERALTEARAEIGQLRALKEKSPLEAMRDAAEFKSYVEEVTGGGEKEDSTVAQVIGAIAPVIDAFSSRVQNAPVQQPMPQQPMRPRRRRPVVPQQGAPVPQAAPVPQQPAQPGQPAPPQPLPAPAQTTTIELSASDVSAAVTFLETVASNGTAPETFIDSARQMIPQNILMAIQHYGIERFLVEVAKVPEHSVLFTVAGRKYLRRVATLLTQGQAP